MALIHNPARPSPYNIQLIGNFGRYTKGLVNGTTLRDLQEPRSLHIIHGTFNYYGFLPLSTGFLMIY